MDSLIAAAAFVAPIIVIGVFALPSYISLIKQRGFVGLFILLLLGVYAIAATALAVKTGLPYGKFSYDSAVGYQLFGIVPWLVVVVYPSLVLAAFWLASKFTSSGGRIFLTALFATMIGLMLDPVMAKLELLRWERSGIFYGIPLVDFAGWLLVTAVAATLLHVLWGKENFVARGIAYGGLLFVLFWVGANIGVEQWIPAAIGGIVGGLMLLLAGIEKWANTRETAG